VKVRAVLLLIGRQLWSLVSDHEWNFDPFKIGGFAAFGLSASLILHVVEMTNATHPDAVLIGIVSGLVTVPITMGTFLFSLASKSDQALMSKPTKES